MKLIPAITGLLTLIGIIFGVYFWIDGRYAQAQQVKQIEQRLDYKIKTDQAQGIQQRIWQIEDRCGVSCNKCDVTTKEELRKLRADLEDTRGQLKVMEKK